MLNEESIKFALLGAAVGAGIGLVLKRPVLDTALVGGGATLAATLLAPAVGSAVHGHLVGAPPPGSDYSFTRAPGYNDKNY
jgi:hypothetical protein